MRQFALILFTSTLFLAGCQSKPVAIPYTPLPPRTATEAELIRAMGFLPQQVAFAVVENRMNQTARGHQEGKALLPASVTKMVTTIAALHVLGPDYRWKTTLGYKGKIQNGALVGDLYLVGRGDPFLLASDLMSFVEDLRARKITEVRGNFFFDDAFLTTVDRVDPLHDPTAPYNTSISALSVEFNRAVLHRDGKAKELAVRDGGRFTAELFAQLANLAGVHVPPPKPAPAMEKITPLSEQLSPPLWDLSRRCLEYSNNFIAELLLLTTARKLSGVPQPLPLAAQTVAQWLKTQIPNIDWAGFRLANGSGLSKDSRMTPKQLLAMLEWAEKNPTGKRSFLSLLPISGLTGTLRQRMQDAQLMVWAKTGTLDYASALSGYFFTAKKKKMSFAILIADLEKNAASPPIDVNPQADEWTERARRLQDTLVVKWIEEN